MFTLEQLVERYLRSDQKCLCEAELKEFEGLDLAVSISRSAQSIHQNGKRFSHQRRLTKTTLSKAEKLLLAAETTLAAVNSFDDLHSCISDILTPLRGAGPLYIYDVSLRIGVSLGFAPAIVYLHTGALTGARLLGVKGNKVQLAKFPPELNRLSPAQAEDFLCVHKNDLAKLNRLIT